MEIDYQTILNKLKSRLHFYIVLYEDDVLFVTNDDKLYGYGLNETGLLGLGHKNPSTREPTELVELSGKKIVNISYGRNHVLALTDCGDIYSWGSNSYGQLGIGSTKQCLVPSLVCQPSINIVSNTDIKFDSFYCGALYNYAIAKNGQLFGWGCNQFHQICLRYLNNKLVPQIVPRLERYFVISISIGGIHSMALTDQGELLLWTKRYNWRIFKFDSPIKAFACGGQHSLLLTDEGAVYAFGSNKYGQIGCETKPDIGDSLVPIRVNELDEPCLAIGAHHTSNLSIAISQNSQTCYVWGELAGERGKVWKPRKTSLPTINSAFERYAEFKCSPFLIDKSEIDNNNNNNNNNKQQTNLETLKLDDRISNRLATLFDDSANSDLQFNVDGRVIKVHRLILKLNSVYFNRMLSTNGKWSKLDTIKISDYSFAIYYKYLRYLYTGQLALNTSDSIEFLQLALDYQDTDLQVQCITILRNCNDISEDCCLSLYRMVQTLARNSDNTNNNSKLLVNQFKSFIVDYARNNLSIDLEDVTK